MNIKETSYDWGVGRQIVEASFSEWLDHVFGKGEDERDWISDDGIPDWALPPEVTLGYIERTFRESAEVLAERSCAQVANGLNFIHNNTLSNIPHLFKDENISLSTRLAALRSIADLYDGCFSHRCQNTLSHWSAKLNPLNSVCYMWWDVFVVYGNSETADERAANEECLQVMEKALVLNHDACRESALHGLGHWEMYYPERVQQVVGQFLRRNPNLSPELTQYAESARRGGVQ